MSFKFPANQKYKERICFHCKKKIDIADYFVTNKSKYPIEKLIQLWEHDKLEFYCCLCYDRYLKSENLTKLTASLIEKDREILKLLKLKYSIDLQIVDKIEYNTIGVTIRNKQITGLGLFKCVEKFPEIIAMLTSLENLNLAWNSLTELPKSICNLHHLKVLDLIGNNLTSIPKEIRLLTSLEELDLSYNKLRNIPNTIGELPSLRTLNLIHNEIIMIPESLKELELNGLKILF